MNCMLVKVGLILCLDFTPDLVSEIQCVKKTETIICVEPNQGGDCYLDSADDFLHGEGKFDERNLTQWMNDSCEVKGDE